MEYSFLEKKLLQKQREQKDTSDSTLLDAAKQQNTMRFYARICHIFTHNSFSQPEFYKYHEDKLIKLLENCDKDILLRFLAGKIIYYNTNKEKLFKRVLSQKINQASIILMHFFVKECGYIFDDRKIYKFWKNNIPRYSKTLNDNFMTSLIFSLLPHFRERYKDTIFDIFRNNKNPHLRLSLLFLLKNINGIEYDLTDTLIDYIDNKDHNIRIASIQLLRKYIDEHFLLSKLIENKKRYLKTITDRVLQKTIHIEAQDIKFQRALLHFWQKVLNNEQYNIYFKPFQYDEGKKRKQDALIKAIEPLKENPLLEYQVRKVLAEVMDEKKLLELLTSKDLPRACTALLSILEKKRFMPKTVNLYVHFENYKKRYRLKSFIGYTATRMLLKKKVNIAKNPLHLVFPSVISRGIKEILYNKNYKDKDLVFINRMLLLAIGYSKKIQRKRYAQIIKQEDFRNDINRALALGILFSHGNIYPQQKAQRMAIAYMYSLPILAKINPGPSEIIHYHTKLFEYKFFTFLRERRGRKSIWGKALRNIVKLLEKYPQEKMYEEYSFFYALELQLRKEKRKAFLFLQKAITKLKPTYGYANHLYLYTKLACILGKEQEILDFLQKEIPKVHTHTLTDKDYLLGRLTQAKAILYKHFFEQGKNIKKSTIQSLLFKQYILLKGSATACIELAKWYTYTKNNYLKHKFFIMAFDFTAPHKKILQYFMVRSYFK